MAYIVKTENKQGKSLNNASFWPNIICQYLAKIKNKGGLPGSVKTALKGAFGFPATVAVQSSSLQKAKPLSAILKIIPNKIIHQIA